LRELNENLGENDAKDTRDAQLPGVKLRGFPFALFMFFEVWFVGDPYFCSIGAA